MSGRMIYFGRCVAANGADMGAIKIGCSARVEERIAAISTQVPFTCEKLATCPGGWFAEEVLHMWLRADQIRGEFFHDRGETRRLTNLVAATGELPFMVPDVPHWEISSVVALAFMAAHGITAATIAALTGGKVKSYEAMLATQVLPSRRVVAALTVAAIQKQQAVDWPQFIETERAKPVPTPTKERSAA